VKGRTTVYLHSGGKHTVQVYGPADHALVGKQGFRKYLYFHNLPYPPQTALGYGVEYPPHVLYSLSFPTGAFSHFPTVCLPSLSQYEESNLGHFLTKEVLCRLTILAGVRSPLALLYIRTDQHGSGESRMGESNSRHYVTKVGHFHYANSA
jgi:hypothetical protein